MYRVKNYKIVSSLEEAYELNQKSRNNVIVAGNLWLRLGNRQIQNAIDLSRLGLDQITETEEGFLIGCMVTLRQLELHEGLNNAFQGLFEKAVCHIVGVQFRNCATVGGSLFPRFGFSDVLTAFLACDSQIDLYKAGRLPLSRFVDMERDSDILTHVFVRKDGRKTAYQTFRMTETDFPVLTCGLYKKGEDYGCVIGARPKAASLVEGIGLSHPQSPEDIESFSDQVIEHLDFGSNMRGSASYRKELARVLIRRCFEELE